MAPRTSCLVAALGLVLAACNAGGGTVSTDTTSAEGSPTTVSTTAPPAPASTAPPPPAGPVDIQFSVVATELEVPWGIAFLPDRSALITERDSGRLLRLTGAGPNEVQRLPEEGEGEGGLLGLAVSPIYEEDGLVYAYYSTASDNRVVRFRLGEQPQPILTGIPVGPVHNGGRIVFGPDGLLYVGTGESGVPTLAQDLGSLGGKILRIAPDGSVPPDNPFPGSPVWSLGHRNVQGLAFDGQGRLWATEFGERRADEVNLIQPGANYGWPAVEGVDPENRFAQPVVTFTPKDASPSGAVVLSGGAIPQWEGDLFFAALRGRRLWRLDLTPEGTVAGQEELLHNRAGRLRTVAQAPDGSLWVLTSNRDGRGDPNELDDRILRLGPPRP